MAKRRKKKKERLVAEDMLGWLGDDLDDKTVDADLKEPRVHPKNAAARSTKTLSPGWSHKEGRKFMLDIERSGAGNLITAIYPDDKNYKSSLCRADKGGKMRACHVELRFVGEKASKKSGLPKGAFLRFCTERGKPGAIVRVTSGKQAAQISRAFCECRKKEDIGACVVQARAKVGTPDHPNLGGLRRPKK